MTLKAAAITGEAPDMKELPATQTRDWVTACPPGSPALTNSYTFQRMRNPSYMTTELLYGPVQTPFVVTGTWPVCGSPYALRIPVPLFSYSSSTIH